VLAYIQAEELYQIRWLCNNTTKKVSRFNLIFHREDHTEFFKRVDEAKGHREDAELIMKYSYLVDTTAIPPADMSDDQKTRISFQIASFDSLEHIKNRQIRNPMAFMEKEAKDRYGIPKGLTEQRPLPESCVQDIHEAVKSNKFNLNTMRDLFQELD